MPHQSFIVVRPPPSKTNHPLNLQIQLLPPKNKDASRSTASHRGRSSDGSIAAVDDDGTAEGLLTLPDANHSAISMYSSSSSYSTASLTSFASTSSASAGGRRAVVPLYNLQAHSVLASTIVDARTDAKVAKFHKRGLELVGLATLEPVEVWGGDGSGRCPPPRGLASDKSTLTVADTTGSARARESAEPARGALSESASSLSALSHTFAESSVTPVPLSTPLSLTSFTTSATPKSPSGTKRFLGKLFKRPVSERRANADPHPYPPSPLLAPSITASAHPLQHASAPLLTAAILTAAIGGGSPSPVTSGSRSSESSLSIATVIPPAPWGLPTPPPSEPRSSTSTSVRESPSAASQRPTVLGVQGAISSRTQPPRGRPTKYVWTVRKWHKRGAQANGSLSETKEKLRARDAASASCAVESLVEVRFEWTRGDKRRRSRNRRDRREDGAEHATDVDSGIVPASASPVSTTERDRESCSPDEEDAEEDSEPEDSEIPWTCTLTLRRRSASRSASPPHSPPLSSPNHGGGSGSSPNQAQPRSKPTLAAATPGASASPTGSNPCTVRVKVARVVPTPHHPKIVALLKAPFPLPDVDVARVHVQKRAVEAAPVPAPVVRVPAASVDSRPGTPHGRGKGGGSGRKGFFGGSKSEAQISVADAEIEFTRGGPGLPEHVWDGTGLILTAEEIKDVVASTALWLVVREGFGGVGRVSRKGDRSWGVR